jgi:hypothetical protein
MSARQSVKPAITICILPAAARHKKVLHLPYLCAVHLRLQTPVHYEAASCSCIANCKFKKKSSAHTLRRAYALPPNAIAYLQPKWPSRLDVGATARSTGLPTQATLIWSQIRHAKTSDSYACRVKGELPTPSTLPVLRFACWESSPRRPAYYNYNFWRGTDCDRPLDEST